MFNYDYKRGKKNIINILNSKTEIREVDSIPNNESEFTYENGIRTWVGALFIDIRNSTSYFKDNKAEKVARVMRAFCSEIISILKQNTSYRQIGIRGDCVYAAYSISNKSDLEKVLDDSITINTFQKMFQSILQKNSFPTFEVGIGLGASKDLVVKAGMKGTGISDNIWIGNAVIDASKLSSQGSTDGFASIVMDQTFYGNIKDFKANGSDTYQKFFNKKHSEKLNEDAYHGSMIFTNFNKWIDEGMR